MAVMTQDLYHEDFKRRASQLPGNAPWLAVLRAQAMNHFATHGLPTSRDERWKYTRLTPLEKQYYPAAGNVTTNVTLEQLAPWLMKTTEYHRLVFIDGQFSAALSQCLPTLPAGVTLTHLATALEQPSTTLQAALAKPIDYNQYRFSALNTALMTDGALLEVADYTTIVEPIHLLFINTAPQTAAYLRNIIILGKQARADVIEHYVSLNQESSFCNPNTQAQLEEHSYLAHYLIQQQNEQTTHIGAVHLQQAAHSQFHSHAITLGGALVRNDINVQLNAEHTHCQLKGLYLARGRQHIDYHTHVDHSHPLGSSHEHYKGIIADRARGVFNGKILVRQDAQKTDAQLTNQNLLLSRHAEIDTKPELEIYADDVKCSHGATIGQLDENSLFYLRSRGIDAVSAQQILTYAFASEVIDSIAHTGIRQQLHNILVERLFQGQALAEELL